MTHIESTTGSGIRVISEPMSSMRSVTLGLWFTIGSRDEAPHEDGCSHFLEHLLFKGTARRSARDIAEALDAIGGEANAFTSKEVTCFYARALDRDLPIAMDVLADMVVNATNTHEDVEAERDVVLEEINIHVDTPDDLVHSDLSDLLFDGHRLGAETLGAASSIEGMQRDTIHDYFQTHYRPENLIVVAAGNVDHGDLVRMVEDQLGDLGRPGRSPRVRDTVPVLRTRAAHVRNRPTEQAHLAFGGPAPHVHDEQRHALKVASTILGGGMSSRLFQEIREVRGLAYTTYSYVSSFSDAGMLGAYVGTTPARVDEAGKVLVEELARLADTIEPADVEHARSAILGGTVLGLEDTGSRMSRLGQLAAMDRPLTTIDEALARVENIQVDQVRDAAHQFAHPRSLAVVGPFDEGSEDRFAPLLG